jgi:hypothetical protein
MSCPKDITATTSVQNSVSSYVGYNSNVSNNITITNNNRAQYNNNLTQNNPFFKQSKCRKITSKYPSFTPVIFTLSMTSSAKKTYTVVYINGANFLPSCIGTTYVNFGQYKQLPIIYFSNSYISFVVPFNIKVGKYSVVVVNVYNGNFSPQINISYAGDLNYSNTVNYTIT